MAKKDNDAAFEAFLADLKAINPKVEELIADDKVSAKLKEGVLARSELSRQLDALRTERETFVAEVTDARTKIKGWQDWHTNSLSERATLVDRIKRYEEEYGALEGGEGNKPKFVRPDDMKAYTDETLRAREAAYLKFADDLTDLKIEHRTKFNEKLDTQELYKIAGERNIPLDLAYNIFIQDRMEERRTADLKDQIAKAREEGAKDALSKHNLPVLDTRSDVVHSMDVQNAPKTERDRVSAAVAGFRSLMTK